MRVALTIIEQIARARTDLRMGVPVILSAGPAQTLVVPIETLSHARLDQMIASKHHLHMVLTKQRAETLKIAAPCEIRGELLHADHPQGYPFRRDHMDPTWVCAGRRAEIRGA